MISYYLRHLLYILIGAAVFFMTACSSDKFLEDDESILAKVSLKSANKDIKPHMFRAYVRQEPNARWFNASKVQLGLYNLSGKDTTKWVNRFLQRIGEAPRIYDESKAVQTDKYISLALRNRGYLSAYTTHHAETKKKRTHLTYTMYPGRLYTISRIHYNVHDSIIYDIIRRHQANSLLYAGMPCNLNTMDAERNRLVNILQDEGYFKFHKELISFSVDTIAGQKHMELTLHLQPQTRQDSLHSCARYTIDSVYIVMNEEAETLSTDTLSQHQRTYIYHHHPFIRPRTISHSLNFHSGEMYNETAVKNSYSRLNRLQALKHSFIHFAEDTTNHTLDAFVTMQANNPNSISVELEGTNTAGDLGAAASIAYSNRNLFRGSEVLTVKVRGAFEAIKQLEGYSDQNYFELNATTSLDLPWFMLPGLSNNFRKSVRASSEFSVAYNLQNRPEFHRRVLTGALRYKWNKYDSKWQHRYDLLSLNYVSMPWISDTFRKEYLESPNSRNSLLRYSYENLFIMLTGYHLTYNSNGFQNIPSPTTYAKESFQARFNIETAGNLLYAAAKIFKAEKDDRNQYKMFGVAFSQYVKADFDFRKSIPINENNAIAFHFALGMAIPYGNSPVVPYEKRYFAGGANNVRGWSVRELGPGGFTSPDGSINYVAKTGNINLLMSAEYRTKLFWKLHGAAFIDAGNIWTTREYIDQPNGKFHFNSFYKQIAMAYGLGIRLNFDYFILRFDGGMKAINPAYTSTKEHYPLISPKFSRDFTFHFAVGLPF